MRNDRGYTYLVTNGREYKIGITTKTPESRVMELQTGSSTKIVISGYSYNSNALVMEQELHRKFSSKRLEGEWFALSDDDVAVIHNHFENNYIDEYLAPLSEKALIVFEAEKKRKAEENRVIFEAKQEEARGRKERMKIADAKRVILEAERKEKRRIEGEKTAKERKEELKKSRARIKKKIAERKRYEAKKEKKKAEEKEAWLVEYANMQKNRISRST